MFLGQSPRSLLHEVIVAFLCATMLFAGLAQARVMAQKADGAHTFALCLSDDGSPSGTSGDHDCASCRLTSIGALPLPPRAFDTRTFIRLSQVALSQPFALDDIAFLRPWLRGPPVNA